MHMLPLLLMLDEGHKHLCYTFLSCCVALRPSQACKAGPHAWVLECQGLPEMPCDDGLGLRTRGTLLPRIVRQHTGTMQHQLACCYLHQTGFKNGDLPMSV